MMLPTDAAFFEKHCAGGGVISTLVVLPDGSDREGIFSTIDKAEFWVDSFGPDAIAVHSPKIVDYPEYGNEKADG